MVIGNPPYKEKARGLGGWVESPTAHTVVPLRAWMPPVEWGVSAHVKHLRNLYVYLLALGDLESLWRQHRRTRYPAGYSATGYRVFHHRRGVSERACFQKMRADLRRDTDEIWLIRLLARGSPARGRLARVSGSSAAGMRRPRGPACRLRPRGAGAGAFLLAA